MERNGSGVSALLGLDGFVVRAQLLDEDDGRVVAGGGDDRGPGLVPDVRGARRGPRPPPGQGPGPADR